MTTQSGKFSSATKHLYVVEKGQKPSRNLLRRATIAEVGKHIWFNAAALDTFDVKGCRPMHYDILVLCAAVEFADRRWKRPLTWCRGFDVTVPVIDLKSWKKPEVLQSLRAALNYVTGDAWQFTFVQAKDLSPIGERQALLDFSQTKTFAVAYSDGLDSRAATALGGGDEQALCVRISGNGQRRKSGDSYFTQIPFKVKGYRSNESSFRSRGFQFSAVTAIAAELSGVSRVVVPESGQGALGPALLPLHNIYTDYRNHPAFFRKMERFVKALQGWQIRFEQPRLWSTKGQTLRAFLNIDGKSKQDLISTRSCWQTRRIVNAGIRKQCGLCAACLLRRLSLHAVDITELPDTYVVSDLGARDVGVALSALSHQADRDIMVEYGSVGVRHLQHLANLSHLPDEELRTHASQIASVTDEACEETLKKLRTMLITHADEWQAFLAAQGDQSFLNNWMEGGRHGRSE